MSLQSETAKPSNLSLSQLVQRNAQALETRQQIPYQQMVYAIPEEWRRMEEKLLADAVQFQPKLYRQIEALATRAEWQNMMEAQRILILQQSGSMENRIKYLLQLDGKAREKSSSDLSKTLCDNLRSAKDELEKTCRKWVLISAGISVASSALACTLCLLLGG